MRMRFACDDGPTRDDTSGDRCGLCGFAAMRGISTYVEDDAEIVSCSICRAFRHAATDYPGRFRIAWIPELSQPELSHLTRTIAYATAIGGEVEPRIPESKNQRRPFVDRRLFDELMARADVLDAWFLDRFDALPRVVVPTLPTEAMEAILPGLRMLPVAFPRSEISSWRNDESSFSSYGPAELTKVGWYVSILGLRTVHEEAGFGRPLDRTRRGD